MATNNLAGLVGRISRAQRAFKVAALAKLYPTLTGADLTRALQRESTYDRAYRRNMATRLRRGVTLIENDPGLSRQDKADRLTRLEQQERRYLAQHIAAASRRMLREAEQVALVQAGETHAYWLIDRTLQSHTADCMAMEGRVWRLDGILRRVNPANRHAGCGCRLISVREARRRGLPLRRGYETRNLRSAVDFRESLVSDNYLVEAIAVPVRVRAHTRRVGGKIEHVREHVRMIHVEGDVPPSLDGHMAEMLAASRRGDPTAIEAAHSKLRRRILVDLKHRKVDRDVALRTIDRVRARALNPTGHRLPLSPTAPIAPIEDKGLHEPWSARGKFLWMVPEHEFGEHHQRFLDNARASGMYSVKKVEGGHILEVKSTRPAIAFPAARELERRFPSLRTRRIESKGVAHDTDAPIEIHDDEARSKRASAGLMTVYRNVSWGQLGDAGELAINDVARRMKDLGMLPEDADVEWPTMGQRDTPADWIFGRNARKGFMFEVKSVSMRGQTAGRADDPGTGKKTGGSSIDADALARKHGDLRALNAIRRRQGLPPITPMLATMYVDLDNDVVHVVVTRYGKGQTPFTSRRVPAKLKQDLFDGKLTPGETRSPATGTQTTKAHDPAQATTYVGSFRLKFNPLRPGDTGERLTPSQIQARKDRPTVPADVLPVNAQVQAPPKQAPSGKGRSVRRQAADVPARNKLIVKLGKAGKHTQRELGEHPDVKRLNGGESLTQPQISNILNAAGVKRGRGARTDRRRK